MDTRELSKITEENSSFFDPEEGEGIWLKSVGILFSKYKEIQFSRNDVTLIQVRPSELGVDLQDALENIGREVEGAELDEGDFLILAIGKGDIITGISKNTNRNIQEFLEKASERLAFSFEEFGDSHLVFLDTDVDLESLNIDQKPKTPQNPIPSQESVTESGKPPAAKRVEELKTAEETTGYQTHLETQQATPMVALKADKRSHRMRIPVTRNFLDSINLSEIPNDGSQKPYDTTNLSEDDEDLSNELNSQTLEPNVETILEKPNQTAPKSHSIKIDNIATLTRQQDLEDLQVRNRAMERTLELLRQKVQNRKQKEEEEERERMIRIKENEQKRLQAETKKLQEYLRSKTLYKNVEKSLSDKNLNRSPKPFCQTGQTLSKNQDQINLTNTRASRPIPSLRKGSIDFEGAKNKSADYGQVIPGSEEVGNESEEIYHTCLNENALKFNIGRLSRSDCETSEVEMLSKEDIDVPDTYRGSRLPNELTSKHRPTPKSKIMAPFDYNTPLNSNPAKTVRHSTENINRYQPHRNDPSPSTPSSDSSSKTLKIQQLQSDCAGLQETLAIANATIARLSRPTPRRSVGMIPKSTNLKHQSEALTRGSSRLENTAMQQEAYDSQDEELPRSGTRNEFVAPISSLNQPVVSRRQSTQPCTPSRFGLNIWDPNRDNLSMHLETVDRYAKQARNLGYSENNIIFHLLLGSLPPKLSYVEHFIPDHKKERYSDCRQEILKILGEKQISLISDFNAAHRIAGEDILEYFFRITILYKDSHNINDPRWTYQTQYTAPIYQKIHETLYNEQKAIMTMKLESSLDAGTLTIEKLKEEIIELNKLSKKRIKAESPNVINLIDEEKKNSELLITETQPDQAEKSAPRLCYHCNRPGHFKSNCYAFLKLMEQKRAAGGQEQYKRPQANNWRNSANSEKNADEKHPLFHQGASRAKGGGFEGKLHFKGRYEPQRNVTFQGRQKRRNETKPLKIKEQSTSQNDQA